MNNLNKSGKIAFVILRHEKTGHINYFHFDAVEFIFTEQRN
jgi:hypothetical protein